MDDIQVTELKPKKVSKFKRFLRWLLLIIVVAGSLMIWWKYFYVFGEGVKSGELNYVVKKGNLFKTFEGKLIQSGIRSKAAGSIQSYEFEFSITNDSIANVLMNNSGKYFDLHYKEYKGTVPWRGYTKYIVDEIRLMKEIER
ncbi:hypothetical protein ACQ33O_06175 [Ferruginibacter sp. SUN002]|uniref:hypothetical protein n=1 Tax=Ferruginibacter sp. SUN002 TaxID=2937789 RepID=UPI003D35E543